MITDNFIRRRVHLQSPVDGDYDADIKRRINQTLKNNIYSSNWDIRLKLIRDNRIFGGNNVCIDSLLELGEISGQTMEHTEALVLNILVNKIGLSPTGIRFKWFDRFQAYNNTFELMVDNPEDFVMLKLHIEGDDVGF